jgi:hypothetical protein
VLERDVPQYQGKTMWLNVAGWIGIAAAMPSGTRLSLSIGPVLFAAAVKVSGLFE